jgi:hypothetical protein
VEDLEKQLMAAKAAAFDSFRRAAQLQQQWNKAKMETMKCEAEVIRIEQEIAKVKSEQK